MSKIELAGKIFQLEASYDYARRLPTWIVRINTGLTWKKFLEFPWEKLPNGKMVAQGRLINIQVHYSEDSFFWSDDFSEVKEKVKKIIWTYKNPVAAKIKYLKNEREWHEKQMQECREKVKEGKLLVLCLRWNEKRQSWQAKEDRGDNTVIYTVNERISRPDSREPGQWYCQFRKANAFRKEPSQGGKGFILHVIDPVCRIYDTDSEIIRLMPRCEAANPLI